MAHANGLSRSVTREFLGVCWQSRADIADRNDAARKQRP